MADLRAAVIGLGCMGRNHARVLSGVPGVELAALVDPSIFRLDQIVGTPSSCPRSSDVSALAGLGIDMAIVATPAQHHADVAIELARMRIPSLIEKPLAPSSEEGRRVVEAFEQADVLGCVGHIERFNPAVVRLREIARSGAIGELLQLSSTRHGPRPDRVRDVGVVMDLATHDLDLGQWLLGGSYDQLDAATAALSGRCPEDLVEVLARTSSGVVVTHSVNWVSTRTSRTVVLLGTGGSARADLLTHDVDLEHASSSAGPAGAWIDGPAHPPRPRQALPGMEPLARELHAFRDAVLGRQVDLATVRDGLRVVLTAERVLASARRLPGPTAPCEDVSVSGSAGHQLGAT